VAASVVRFGPVGAVDVKPHRVYLRERWGEAWTYVPDLHCVRASWSMAPTIPTAELSYRYGYARRQLAAVPAQVARSAAYRKTRWFVKVEIDTHSISGETNDAMVWVGTLEVEASDMHGAIWDANLGAWLPSGRLGLHCLGLEFLLDREVVGDSWATLPQEAGEERRLHRGIRFNNRGEPNRTADLGDLGAYLFSGEPSPLNRRWWSTRDAVGYLIAYHAPRDDGGDVSMPWSVVDPTEALPAWDRVSLPTQGSTTFELLNSLIARQRLLGWFLKVSASDEIELHVATFADSPIWIADLDASIPANANQVEIACEQASDVALGLKRSTLDAADQVVVYGARRTSTFGTSFEDVTIAAGWTETLEEQYEAAASTAGDYPSSTDVEDRQWRNVEARKAAKFDAVYARFVLPEEWDGKAGDGQGGDTNPVFPITDFSSTNLPWYPPDLAFLPRLAIKTGYDYSGYRLSSGSVLETVVGQHEYMPPQVFFPRRDSSGGDKWKSATDSSLPAPLETYGAEDQCIWSARVEVRESDPALWLRVTNTDQYVIAADDFTPLAEDPPFGSDSIRDAIFVVSVEWDAYASGTWPVVATTITDAARILHIPVGDATKEGFRCDYVLPGTPYAVDPITGDLIRSTSGGFVRDDRKILQALAKIAYAWYGRERSAIDFVTSRPNVAMKLGQLVTAIGDSTLAGADLRDADVASVITSIVVEIPIIEAEGPISLSPASMRVQTSFGELDLVPIARGLQQQ